MISEAEMDRRWSLVRAEMEQKGLDWIIAPTGHVFGYARWLTNRIGLVGTLAAIPLKGKVALFSHGDAIHSTPTDSYGVKHYVSCAQPNILVDSQAPILLDVLKGTDAKRIGVLGMGFLSAAAYKTMIEGFPNVEFVDATEWIAPLKAQKGPDEIAAMRRAALMHEMAVEVVRETVRAGITSRDVMNAVRDAMWRAGSSAQTLMAGSAPVGTPCKYQANADRVIEPGDQFAMLIECAEDEGYYSEVMPTVCLGSVPAPLQKVFDEACEAQEVMAKLARPGADPMDILEASNSFMRDRGYPEETRLAGHAQGLDLVERPALSPLGETIPLAANSIISLHPTVHGKTAWGFPINQSFLVGEESTTRMMSLPQQIIVV